MASLSWAVATVKTPWADVLTAHWAVPDDDDQGETGTKPTAGAGDGKKPAAAQANAKERALLQQAEKAVEQRQNDLDTAEDELGAVLWNSNTVAASVLDRHFFGGASHAAAAAGSIRVLELGAGVGCLGIACAARGCHACITDIPRLMPLLQCNIDLNKRILQQRSPAAAAPDDNNKQPEPGTVFAAGVDWKSKKLPPNVEQWWTATTTAAQPLRRFVVMVDALYGDQRAWPGLILLLRQLVDGGDSNDKARAAPTEILNFCEQRVQDVEQPFLTLLEQENAEARKKQAGGSEWQWETKKLEEKSEMKMPIHFTRIWRAPAAGSRRNREE